MSDIEPPHLPTQLVRVNPYTLTPGLPVIFRNAGSGPPRYVTVMPRGPIGQFMVKFEAGFTLAVNEGRELFRTAP